MNIEEEGVIDFHFEVSLFEQYIKLVKYHSEIIQEDGKDEYQLCQDYFYDSVLGSIPFSLFVLLTMIVKYRPEKQKDVEEYIKEVVRSYDYPNQKYC